MDRISGAGNWKLTVRRETAGITVLRAVTCDEQAVLPDSLWDIPVTALGDHALAPGAVPAPGEEMFVTCGPAAAGAPWDNRRLRELALPETLEQVGDYAFFGCVNLKTLRLGDGVRRWGGGAVMNCSSLDTFSLSCTGREGEILAYFAGELSGELDVTLRWPDRTEARLIFPEYAEIYEENCPAHHFDYQIRGAGYGYHHCFYQRKLDLKAYDALWTPMLAMEHDGGCALRLAWWRLRCPAGLTEEAAADYRAYLRSHVPEAAAYLLSRRDSSGLSFLLAETEPDREAISAACALAREQGAAEALALLLEERHRRFPGGWERRFEL